MARIEISKKFEDIFNSIVWLKSNGFIDADNSYIRSVGEGLIVTAEAQFVLGKSEEESSEDEERLCFKKDGAGWFSGLRAGGGSGDAGLWKGLITRVADDYHHGYSFLTFKQTLDDGRGKKDGELVKRFFEEVFQRIYTGGFALSSGKKTDVTICGLSLRLSVNYGVGESQPMLGSLFFRREGEGFSPLPKDHAAMIKEVISRTPDSSGDDAGSSLTPEDGRIRDEVFSAFSEFIAEAEGKTGDNDFTDYLVFSGKDEEILKVKKREMAPNGPLELGCSEIRALGISRVEWQALSYDVMYGNRPVVRLTVGPNGALDAECLCCGDKTRLVDDGKIKCKDGKVISLDPSKKDFGLSDADIEKIKENSAFADHIITPTYCRGRTTDGCSKTICRSQALAFDGGIVCRDCRKPDIVYSDLFDPSSPSALTCSLSFALDEMKMLPEEKTFTCKCCRKVYSVDERKGNGLCSACSKPDVSEEGRRTYREYSKILSPLTRIIHLFAKNKTCRRGGGGSLLIFRLGKDTYVFDCAAALDGGLIKGPYKFKE